MEAMKVSDIELEKIKKCELEMLEHFIKACEKLNLKYYLMGGTLLGAVRHQGFIPWDDDIDVGMLREDYEVFISKAAEFLPENYFVQTHLTDPEYPYNFAKIRNSETTFLETTLRKLNINHGVFIDVFPLDIYPDDQAEIKTLEFKKKFYLSRIKEVFYGEAGQHQSLLGKVQFVLAKICYPDYKKAVIKKEALLKSVKNGAKIANHGGAWGAKEIVPAQWYGEGAPLVFEGISVRGPKEYDLWLTQVYGDYMKLPPVEKRITHHYTDAIDVEKSYKHYTKFE